MRRAFFNVCKCRSLFALGAFLLFAAGFLSSCSGKGKHRFDDNFNSLTVEQKMDALMEKGIEPDSLAVIICDAAMGKDDEFQIDLTQARAYVYEKYNEDQLVAFENQCLNYEFRLPLHEKVKFERLAGLTDPSLIGYELGLSYVGDIRENKKTEKEVAEELALLKEECQRNDKETYKRFMKGFKTALKLDRHRDLDDKIYLKFISYPDSIK